MMRRLSCRIAGVLALLAASVAIAGSSTNASLQPRRLVLATTTSVADSGLLGVLIPPLVRTRPVRVDVVAVGTGQALALARRGDADAVLIHHPAREREFVDAGYGVKRTCIAHNTFAIVGPTDDPARVRSAGTAAGAFARIASLRVPFVSRGDGSGTEAMERETWRLVGSTPRGEPWYLASGAGMGATLILADEKRAYTLTDVGTYLALRARLRLALLFESDPRLVNQYAAIAVNPDRFPHVNFADAVAFVTYLRSPDAQRLIATFGRERFSRPLFVPLGGRCLQ